MHDRPQNPCRESRELCKTQVGHCICPPYDSEITLIPIPKWLRRPVSDHTVPNDTSDVLALLDSGLSYPRHHHGTFRLDAQQISNRSNHMSGVANCKNFRMSGNRKLWSDNDFSVPVCFYS